MKVNLTPPVEIAALIQTPSFRKLSLSFNCLEYGKRSHCLTDLDLSLVHTMPGKFENATLGAKKEQKFSVHT